MDMLNPPHPGRIIREEIIEPLGLTVKDAAVALDVGRQALSALLNERAALSAEMAIRIEKAFGPKMDHLLQMQFAYDLAQAKKRMPDIRVKPYQPA